MGKTPATLPTCLLLAEKRALVTVGRVSVSGEPGMRLCAAWLKTVVKELPAKWIGAGDPYWKASIMTAREVVELMKKTTNGNWNPQSTRDTFKVGERPDTQVQRNCHHHDGDLRYDPARPRGRASTS